MPQSTTARPTENCEVVRLSWFAHQNLARPYGDSNLWKSIDPFPTDDDDHGPCKWLQEGKLSGLNPGSSESDRTVVGRRLRNRARFGFVVWGLPKWWKIPGPQLFGKRLVFMFHQPVGFQFAFNQKKAWDALICRICSHFVSPHDNPLPWLCLKDFNGGFMGIPSLGWLSGRASLRLGWTWSLFRLG